MTIPTIKLMGRRQTKSQELVAAHMLSLCLRQHLIRVEMRGVTEETIITRLQVKMKVHKENFILTWNQYYNKLGEIKVLERKPRSQAAARLGGR